MKKTVRSVRKWFAVLMIGILLVASLSSCASQEKVLKIGYVTEQTGVEAYIGQASIPALQDRIDKIGRRVREAGQIAEILDADDMVENVARVADGSGVDGHPDGPSRQRGISGVSVSQRVEQSTFVSVSALPPAHDQQSGSPARSVTGSAVSAFLKLLPAKLAVGPQ